MFPTIKTLSRATISVVAAVAIAMPAYALDTRSSSFQANAPSLILSNFSSSARAAV
ncbi:hypothetical protein [Polaromonas jejuensis]|uniref:hypothetical protein n=1 Tax=Polaromonas jejuensis TaxID=457502 RepID=UPI000A74DDF2|nr:hypothetical protein [Polaromonas jejuensis]